MTISEECHAEAKRAGFAINESSHGSISAHFPECRPAGDFVDVWAPSGAICAYVTPANDAAVRVAMIKLARSMYGGVAQGLTTADPWYITRAER